MAQATVTKPPVTAVERVGTTAGLISLLGFVYFLVYPHVVAPVNTLDGVQSTAATEMIVAIVTLALALLGTIFSLPGLMRRMSPGRATSTVISGATLIVAALFMFLSLLPHVQNLQTLKSTTQPFAITIRDNCQTPLNTATSDYQQTAKDAAATQAPAAFASAMQTDATKLQGDLTTLTNSLATLNATTAPQSKYQALLDGCKKDVSGDIAFLGSPQAIPTAQALAGADTLVDVNVSIPAALKPSVKDSLMATLPTSLSALQLVNLAPLAATGGAPVKLATDVPPGAEATVTGIVKSILAAGVPQIVAAAMNQAGAATDATLTSEGNQLSQDIKDTLTNNLAPFPVDVNAIVK